jgi:hypothetical protein
MSLPLGSASGAGTNLKTVAYRLHKFESGRVRAACTAGSAVTPLPKHAIRPGLCVLGKTDNLPILPEVEYVSQTNETETRQIIATFDTLMQEKALQ